ncbi:MAG TPA: VCBS repeat-containing protein, partial [Myxococcota bacterium]|nr:VCBS repeat-containing protein [Myxococcota bacterium]
MLFALLSPSFALSFVPAFYDQVAAAGDVDGDGLADVVAIDCSTGQLDLYAGSAGGLDDSPTFSLVTGGCTVAGVGDLDGDSFAEVIVGNASANGGDGELILYRGGSTAWTEWRRWSGQSGEGLGAVVAGIGDVDGDGIGDFAAVSHVAPSAADGLDRLSVWYGATVGDSAAWTWEQSVLAGFYSDSEPLWVGSGDVDG